MTLFDDGLFSLVLRVQPEMFGVHVESFLIPFFFAYWFELTEVASFQ
jgi:hypothetical protein